MATRTSTTTVSVRPADDVSAGDDALLNPTYPDPRWSDTTLNYYRDSSIAPPDTDNASELSEHELRQLRRADDSPHVIATPVRIRNIRTEEDEYSIEKQGFCVARLASQMPQATENWRDDHVLKRIYFPEIDALLKHTTGCKETHQYEWHVRSRTLSAALATSSEGAVDIDGPVRRVHIDETPTSAKREFAYHHPSLSAQLAREGRKFGIFNVWKPLKTVRRDPLCLCDERSVRDGELEVGKVVVPKVGEIENFALRAPGEGREGGGHGWCYLRGMGVEGGYVFRIYDGRVDDDGVDEGKKRSHGVAHASFVDPGTEDEAARESVEVRSFCVF